jgi:hypothetical protein
MKVRDVLDRAEVPGARAAEERAWSTIAAAYAEREPAPARKRVRPLVAAVVAVAVAVPAVLTPAGDAVADWIREVVRPAPRTEPAPAVALPAPGRILIETPHGTYVLADDGTRRRLGDWHDATWSPQGRFVAAVRANTLVALTPRGEVRWTLERPFPLRQPAWAPDGFTVAYRSGNGLRALAGDGTGDRFLTGPIGPAAPVWRAGRRPTVTIADARGRVVTIDPSRRTALWRSAPGPQPHTLAWSPDGRVLAAVGLRGVRLFTAGGRPLRPVRASRGEELTAAAFVPRSPLLALVRRSDGHSRVTVGRAGRPGEEVFQAPGRIAGVTFSPDGRWMLLGWRVADEWLFLSSPTLGRGRGERVVPVSGISSRIAPAAPGRWAFPEVRGWAAP